jgi:hypothetical protein
MLLYGATRRQKVKQCDLGGFHQRATAEPEGQKAKGKSSIIKGFQLLKKFGGTETDTANFSLLPMS